jgi:hypothetical protein
VTVFVPGGGQIGVSDAEKCAERSVKLPKARLGLAVLEKGAGLAGAFYLALQRGDEKLARSKCSFP